ncbi:hypothetical protein VP01_2966g1 [Puccinia sorghi]|uniref:Uncharacterized protein n=1 Tax=Puccinia sorghi TaxID=27349 RepID=A0A0L6V0Q9_9BASI|nr:hypothetical protein VP01_2966g1 [Puccinia sorghi]
MRDNSKVHNQIPEVLESWMPCCWEVFLRVRKKRSQCSKKPLNLALTLTHGSWLMFQQKPNTIQMIFNTISVRTFGIELTASYTNLREIPTCDIWGPGVCFSDGNLFFHFLAPRWSLNRQVRKSRHNVSQTDSAILTAQPPRVIFCRCYILGSGVLLAIRFSCCNIHVATLMFTSQWQDNNNVKGHGQDAAGEKELLMHSSISIKKSRDSGQYLRIRSAKEEAERKCSRSFEIQFILSLNCTPTCTNLAYSHAGGGMVWVGAYRTLQGSCTFSAWRCWSRLLPVDVLAEHCSEPRALSEARQHQMGWKVQMIAKSQVQTCQDRGAHIADRSTMAKKIEHDIKRRGKDNRQGPNPLFKRRARRLHWPVSPEPNDFPCTFCSLHHHHNILLLLFSNVILIIIIKNKFDYLFCLHFPARWASNAPSLLTPPARPT